MLAACELTYNKGALCFPRLLVSLDSLLKLMNDGYDDLSKLQGEALTGTSSPHLTDPRIFFCLRD